MKSNSTRYWTIILAATAAAILLRAMNNVLPVFIDGRSELYGDDQLRRYATMIHLESGWQDTITSLGITKVLMPRDSRLAAALTRAGWIPVAVDSVGVLLKKP